MMMRSLAAAGAAMLMLAAAGGASAEPPCETKGCPTIWASLDAGQKGRVFALADDYKDFMAKARTPLATVAEAARVARAAGFREWKAGDAVSAGGRYYTDNRGRSLMLFVVGSRPMAEGFRIAAAHIDSPHLTLKARPLYESEGFALFQTDTHGNMLNYQWANTPLALVGEITRKDGKTIPISVGLKPDEPVFMIAGLSPHVDIDLRERKNRDVIAAEELDPIVGSMPLNATEGVLAQVKAWLRETWGVGVDDFVSAELDLVPAMAPRDVGFDRAMMTMNGQDDRLGSWAALRALTELKSPARTSVVLLAGNEEEGNRNAWGAASSALPNLLGELLLSEMGTAYNEPRRARAFAASKVLSIDVNDGVNPTWPSAWEGGNAPRIGQGVNVKVYGKGNNASTQYAAWIRRTLDEGGVRWQTATYKVGRAGGGTLGGEMSKLNMDVIDVGVPVLSIHNTYDISSKVDLFALYRANAAFFTAPD